MVESFNHISHLLLTSPLKDVHDNYKIYRDFTKNSNGTTTPSFKVYSNNLKNFKVETFVKCQTIKLIETES